MIASPRVTLLRAVLAVCSSLSFGCAARQMDAGGPATNGGRGPVGYRPGHTTVGGGDAIDDGVRLEHEVGVLRQGDVDSAIERHQGALVGCYERAGEAQRYAGGRVTLRFLIGGDGRVTDVNIIENTLGNYAVERCLVVEGRRIPFPPPGGNKDTDFEYSLDFRSTGESRVISWDDDALARDAAALSPTLAACGELGPEKVRAVIYVAPDGSVASAGLVSPGTIDASAGICVVEQIRSKWRLGGEPGHMVRASVPVMTGQVVPVTSEPARRLTRRGAGARRTGR